MSVNRLYVGPSLWLLLFFLPVDWVKSQSITQPLSLTIHEGLIYVPVYLSGRGPYRFRLMSNTSETIGIDSRLAKELKLKIVGFQEISEGTDWKRIFLVGVDKVTVGPLTESALQVRVKDYNAGSHALPIDGIIGLPFFADYTIQLDGPNRQLRIVPDTLKSQSRGALTYTTPYLVGGKVGDKDVRVNVDIGSPFSVLFPTASLAGIRYTDKVNSQLITQTKPPYVLQEASMTDVIRLGEVQLTNPLIYHSPRVHQITIGIDLLKSHRIQFNQRRRLIKVE